MRCAAACPRPLGPPRDPADDRDMDDQPGHGRPRRRRRPKTRYRTVFVSDVHLGTRGCQAKRLRRFLKSVDCDRLYLVGDIVDLWAMRRRWHWPQAHNNVVQTILKKAKKGVEV